MCGGWLLEKEMRLMEKKKKKKLKKIGEGNVIKKI